MLNQIRSFAVIAAVFIAGMGTAQAAGPIELVLHKKEIYGARYIEDGEYQKGIERIRARLEDSSDAYSVETPKLIGLCVGYTMSGQTSEAAEFCNKAVDQGWYEGISYNNRGALYYSMGNYAAAIRDFQAALLHIGATGEAQRNLERAQLRLAQQQDRASSESVALLSE